jgi:hypothetical protein
MRAAMKEGKLPQRTLVERRAAAVAQGIISLDEHDHMVYTDRLRRDVIKVDDFDHDLSRGARQEEPWQQQQQDSKKRAFVASIS